jgi:hypothetical protein
MNETSHTLPLRDKSRVPEYGHRSMTLHHRSSTTRTDQHCHDQAFATQHGARPKADTQEQTGNVSPQSAVGSVINSGRQ